MINRGFRFDVFLSYSHADAKLVRNWLHPSLERAGFVVCIDERNFLIGESVLKNTEIAVEDSCVTVLALTPNWVRSRWTEFEALMVQTRDPAGLERRLFPIMLETCDLPTRLGILTYADLTQSEQRDDRLGRVLSQLGTIIRQDRERISGEKSPPIAHPQFATDSPETSHNLPPRSDFINRKKELDELRNILTSRSTVTVIEGLAGVGKTSLALEIAHECAKSGEFDTVVWTSTENQSFELQTLVDTTVRTAEAMHIARRPASEKTEPFLELLRKNRCLIVVDAFDAVNDSRLLDFLRGFPEPSKVLLTSRLLVRDARTVRLSGLEQEDTLELIRLEGRRLGLGGLDDVTDDDLAPLCSVTGGLPLAVRWAIGLVKRGFDLRSVAADLSSASGEIFETMFGEAWERLDDPAKRLLMLMPCFVDSASPELMQRACGLEANEYLEAREELVAACLVEPQGLLTRRRFYTHRLVRTFARARLQRSPNLETEIRKRMTESLLEQLQLDREDYINGFNRIEAELSDILACADWCQRQGRNELVVKLLEAIMEFLWVRGYWSERVTRGRQGLAAAVAIDDGFEAGRFAHGVGWVYSRWGQQDEARTWALEAEERMKKDYPPSMNPYTNELLGLASFRKGKNSEGEGRFDEAERLLKTALKLFERDTRTPNAAYYATTVKDNLGELYRDLGRADEAHRWFEAVLTDANQYDWVERRATANGDLGDLAFEAGDLDKARQLYENGLEQAKSIGRQNTIALCHHGLGRVLNRMGQREIAEDHFRKALRIYKSLGNQQRIEDVQKALSSRGREGAKDVR